MADILDDMEMCINTIDAQVAAMGYKIDKMATSGYSAGGHLALLYAYSRKNAAIPVALTFEQVGPADFTPTAFEPGIFQNRLIMDTFAKVLISGYDAMSNDEKSRALKEISPANYIDTATVPTVMAYAKQDVIVGYNHGPILDERLAANGINHIFLIMPKSNHTCEYDSAVIDMYNEKSLEYCRKYLSSVE